MAQERHMQKDRQMGEVADWGLAIFDPISLNRYGNLQVSAGTLRNTIQLLLRHKPVKFFYIFEQQLRVANLKRLSDLEEVLVCSRKFISRRSIDDLWGQIRQSHATRQSNQG